MIYKMPFYKRETPEKTNIPIVPAFYIPKAINKGLGLPPTKQPLMNDDEYGARCMLLGYDLAKKKYKKKIKKLKAKLKAREDEPIGILHTIEKNDVRGLSFAFEPAEETEKNECD